MGFQFETDKMFYLDFANTQRRMQPEISRAMSKVGKQIPF
jgi:hypothetical protein